MLFLAFKGLGFKGDRVPLSRLPGRSLGAVAIAIENTGGGERVMMSIEEYAEKLGVKIECHEGNFYVSLRDYEKLLERLREEENKVKK